MAGRGREDGERGDAAADLAAVICSLNGAAGVDRCLRALARQTIRSRLEIVLVDDGSAEKDDTSVGISADRTLKAAVLRCHASQRRALRRRLRAAATVFTEAERAALELAEQGTRLAEAAGGVTDEAWANVAKHYDEDQLAALVALIAGINAWNRLNVITQQPAGDYQPGQWG